MGTRTNWSGNYTYDANKLAEPATLDELVEMVTSARAVKALGSRHSFNGIADSPGSQVSLAGLIEPPRLGDGTVTVSAATRYGELGQALIAEGRALHNLASLPHISVAGAVATATHGSGLRLGNLSSAVRALSILKADGELVDLDAGHPDFAGAVVGLGALGIVTELTLATEHSFDVWQTVFANLDWPTVTERFTEIMGAAYSVSLFTDWSEDGVQQVWVKSRDGAVTELFGRSPETVQRHPVGDNPGDFSTVQLGIPGPWNERLPHFRLEFTPSNGEEIQSEYLLPLDAAPAAIEAVRAVADRFRYLLLVCEIRTIAADHLWLSTAYERDSVALHFTWVRDQAAVEAALPALEAALAPFDPRPHWGKVSVMRPKHPRLGDFRALAERWDPRGLFRNAWLDRVLG
ncbi:MAG: FAD-binding protein [Microbacteriaceae bacterium]|nr:FAD-binding protein [Microbacteriaceae bacterium]